MNNDRRWELLDLHRGKLGEQHICITLRRGDGRGICSACIIEDWLKELDEEIERFE